MGASWRSYCQGKGFRTEGSAIEVVLADNRSHWVQIEEREDELRLTAIAVKRAALERSGMKAVRIWEINRALNMVGFRIDDKGRLVAETWLPKLGLEADEFRFALKNLASECDRYEYLLTGVDFH